MKASSSKLAFESTMEHLAPSKTSSSGGKRHNFSRVKSLSYKIRSFSSQRPNHPASSILDDGARSSWRTASGSNHTLVCELTSPALLGHLDILNDSTSEVEVSIALVDKMEEYAVVNSTKGMAHNRRVRLHVGYLPCLYIRIRCVMGTPCSFKRVRAMGIEFNSVRKDLGAKLHEVLITNNVTGLYNPMLPKGLDAIRFTPSAYGRGLGFEQDEKLLFQRYHKIKLEKKIRNGRLNP
eukprot:jgi/Bigna1/143374/aug1.78_g18082